MTLDSLSRDQLDAFLAEQQQAYADLQQAGLKLDVAAANAHVGRWLMEVANVRVHGTTNELPVDRLRAEREHLMPLPPRPTIALPAPRCARPVPVESQRRPRRKPGTARRSGR